MKLRVARNVPILLLLILAGCASSIDKTTNSTDANISVSERKGADNEVFVTLGPAESRLVAENDPGQVEKLSQEVIWLMLYQLGLTQVDYSLIQTLPEWQQAVDKVSGDLKTVSLREPNSAINYVYSVNIMGYRNLIIASGLGTMSVGSNNWTEELKNQYRSGLQMVLSATLQ